MSVWWANAEQNDYMDYLATIPPERRCWCRWALWGDCTNCCWYHLVGTGADYLAAACPECRTLGSHVKGCKLAGADKEGR